MEISQNSLDPTQTKREKTFGKLRALALIALIISGFCLYAWLGLEWVTADVVGAKLPAGCELFFFGKEVQPVFTIALGCPGKDLVRLWPWPIIHPWFEDWWEMNQGLIAFSSFRMPRIRSIVLSSRF